MYLIAHCDDETAELNKIEQMLTTYREQYAVCDFQIERFQSADDLLRMVREEEYMPDLLLMDIYMRGKLGTEAARELREMGSHCRIIFLTASQEHALEAFQVDAMQYLLKPIYEKNLFPVLDRALEEIEQEKRRYLLLRIDSSIRRIALNDMIYCEAKKKQQSICLAGGEQVLLRMTMTKLYEMVSGYQEFAKVGITYIVNLEHIVRLNGQSIQMDNGDKLYLPRGSYRHLREQYFEYYGVADCRFSDMGASAADSWRNEAFFR